MTSSFAFKSSVFFLAAILALLAVAGPALATPPVATSESKDTCTVRTTVTDKEVKELTGDDASTYEAGVHLSLTNPQTADEAGLICTYSLVKYLVNLGIFVIFSVSALLFLVAAFMYLTAGSDPGRRGKALGFIVSGVVGLVIALLARAIPAVVRGIIGI